MTVANFVHLRVHSAYSLSESTLRIATLAKLAQDDSQPAIAITDSFNIFGGYEFSVKMAASGVQPIIGASVLVRDDHGVGNVVLIAQTEAGYIALSQMLSEALMSAEPGEIAAIPIEELRQKSDGLILLSGGAHDGFLGEQAATNQIDRLTTRAQLLKQIFGDRFYVELQRHGQAVENDAERLLIDIADKFDVQLVATNDCHFETAEMFLPQTVLKCIADGKRLASNDSDRFTVHHRFKSAEEMNQLFRDIPEAIENTINIAKRCAFKIAKRDPILPAFTDGQSANEAEALRERSIEGLKLRLEELRALPDSYVKPEDEKSYFDRLDYELGTIINMDFPGYFLIVSDFIGWAKDHDIPVGPGRGSGAGSVVAWALRITDLDPLRWGLLFERFLNPERISMPDFDVDFCQDRREDVIQYVQQKYGVDRVAQIITFGSLQARAALRDVGRVMDMPYGQVDRIAKLVPSNPAKPVTLEQALESEAELATLRDSDEQVEQLLDIAMSLEGLYRHASTHAAGLVIGDRPLPDLVPIYRDPRSEMPVTQFNMKHVEEVGLVKFDFLGLKTLTVIQKAVAFIKQGGVDIDINSLPLDDKKTFEMLTAGDTVGVFQLESSGMRDVLKGLKPDRFEDIIAVVALYRPGPMENIPTYIARKHGREDLTYMHPKLEPILAETYGIMIYQEQVQQAARDLAGYTLGAADILRRAMGKKIQAEMDAQRATFIKGSEDNGIDGQLASDIFDQISAFAGYGFNKSHAAAYALVAYQTAWLKANYPVEFAAASMALDSGNTDKLSAFAQDCLAHKIAVRAPNINKSDASFTVEPGQDDLGAVRYALGAIKNVGAEAMAHLCAERQLNGPFASIEDFAQRLPKEGANKRQIENLIKAGAFDDIHNNRQELFISVDELLSYSDMLRREAESNQSNLFGDSSSAISGLRLKSIADWSPFDRLSMEFEALGLYLSAHPLDSYQGQLDKLGVTSSSDIIKKLEGRESCRVKLAAQLTSLQERVSSRGNRFAFAQFTDRSGGFEATLFSEILLAAKPVFAEEKALLVHADARMENGNLRLLAVRIELLDEAIAAHHSGLGIWIKDASVISDIKDALREDGAGLAPIKFYIPDENRDIEISLTTKFKLSGSLRHKLQNMAGILNIREI